MCLACSHPAAPGHWTEAGSAIGFSHRRGRDRAVEVLQSLLAAEGLTIWRGASQQGFHITTPSGRAMVARTIDDVWPAAQELTGRIVDPLHPLFLQPGRGDMP